ncbi:MAG TPA: M61 family peptidase [Bacteroidota bacterium]|nr:M61 family peptidase [Bacteroidota bacterium]
MLKKRDLILLLIFIPLFLQHALAVGRVKLNVDATDAPRRILHSTEVLDVRPGPLALCYPEWIPGEHAPTGPVVDIAGLHIWSIGAAGSGPKDIIPWRRDLTNMYIFHCDIPEGVSSIEIKFDFILSPLTKGFSSAASSSAHLVVVSWNTVLLYPFGVRPDSIVVSPELRVPDGWKLGTALETVSSNDGTFQFRPVPLNTLVDSPVLAGEFFRRIDISAGTGIPHTLNLASDGAAAIEMPPDQVHAYENLVREATALFGAHHYRHYDFLYTLSDEVSSFGLEHHQSSDDRVGERTVLDDRMRQLRVSLLPHEFVHSWNGKYRRPADLATGDFSSPMKGDLLWVYEGLTEYLGQILTARSGLETNELFREHLAMIAAQLDNRPGRQWRPLQDAADAAQILYGARGDWESYRRSVDYYDEGTLIWLDVDGMIRAQTDGKKSLDDFCRLFHGGADTPPLLKTYTFEDVVATLNEVSPYDWRTFLAGRLNSLEPHAPLAGIERAGWKLVYRDTLSDLMKAYEEVHKTVDLRYSLGANLSEDGHIIDVIPGTPGAIAGLAPGMILVAVDWKKFSRYVIRDAIRLAAGGTRTLELLVQNGDHFKVHRVEYGDGERYPFLERVPSRQDVLQQILQARAEHSASQ